MSFIGGGTMQHPLFVRITAFSFAAACVASLSMTSLGCTHAMSSHEPEPASPVVDYVTQQEILTALPMRVRLPARYGAERVLVFFRTWGSRGWATMELARAGQSWSGEISCREVSTVTGDTRYFFLAFDDDGDAVVGSGSPEWPHVATVVRELTEGASALPGDVAPRRCHDPADCPPDFPGCPAYAVKRASCRVDHDCSENQRCAWDHYCETIVTSEDDADPNLSDEQLLARAVASAKRKYKTIAAERRVWPWTPSRR
jgi:hypothetical protein